MRFGVAALLLVLALPLSAQPFSVDDGKVTFEALITDPRLGEISGFAASRKHPDILWAHNDGGDRAALYAFNRRGELQARVLVSGARNIDWEDLALIERDGRTLLLIADTGDNGGLRRDLAIYAIEEPATLKDQRVRPLWVMPFQWPDGARDCEAMTVDPHSGEILLVSKKRVPPELFMLPAQPSGSGPETARRVGNFVGVDQPDAEDLRENPIYGRYRAQITGVDIRADGGQLALLNYRRIMLYDRLGDESWADAVARVPRTQSYPWLPQAEAIGYSTDGRSVFIGSERVPTPLLRLRVND